MNAVCGLGSHFRTFSQKPAVKAKAYKLLIRLLKENKKDVQCPSFLGYNLEAQTTAFFANMGRARESIKQGSSNALTTI
jgi:hypothetical protein